MDFLVPIVLIPKQFFLSVLTLGYNSRGVTIRCYTVKQFSEEGLVMLNIPLQRDFPHGRVADELAIKAFVHGATAADQLRR